MDWSVDLLGDIQSRLDLNIIVLFFGVLIILAILSGVVSRYLRISIPDQYKQPIRLIISVPALLFLLWVTLK